MKMSPTLKALGALLTWLQLFLKHLEDNVCLRWYQAFMTHSSQPELCVQDISAACTRLAPHMQLLWCWLGTATCVTTWLAELHSWNAKSSELKRYPWNISPYWMIMQWQCVCSGSQIHSYCHLAPFSSGQSHLLSDAVVHLSQASLTPNWLKQSELTQESKVWLQGSRRPCTVFWSVGTCKLCVTFTDSFPPSSPCGLVACGPWILFVFFSMIYSVTLWKVLTICVP